MMFGDVFRDKRVLITGHTGFKGSWLSVWLYLLGAEVTGFALPPEHEEDHFVLIELPKYINHVEGDIRDADHFQKVMEDTRPEFVFHLAAQSLVRRSYVDPKLTFDTNVGGAINVLEAVRAANSVRVLVFVTSDKCYRNREWIWGYRENDELGGCDPYSASKACAELVVASYLASFFNNRREIGVASVRAGNVIGGGDWAEDRILPDCIRALRTNTPIVVRNPQATRPWQHVLEPLGGYLLLAQKLYMSERGKYDGAWNFGSDKEANRTVRDLVGAVIKAWDAGGFVVSQKDMRDAPHEATFLYLDCSKAYHQIDWRPVWDFHKGVHYATAWYKEWLNGGNVWELTTSQIAAYMDAWKKMKGLCL